MRRAASLLLALAVLMACAGCEGGEDITDTLVEVTPEEPSPSAGIVLPGGPASVEAFGVAYSSTASLNPITGTNRLNLELAPLMYEGLFEVTPDYEAEPVLCEEISHEGEVWTVTLRGGVTMSDGEPLTAADVVYSLELARNTDLYAARLRPVRSVMTIDDRTLSIATNGEYGRLELLLDTPVIRAGGAEDSAPPGTGLYTFVKTEDGGYLRVSDSRRGAASLQRIELVDIPEGELMVSSFEQGTVSAASSDPTATDNLDYGGNFEEWSRFTPNMLYLCFNGGRLPAPVRAALAGAVNRPEIAAADLAGAADATNLPASPASALGADADAAPRFAEAASALEALGAEPDDEGFLTLGRSRIALTLIAPEENPFKAAAARRISEDWRQLGVDVTLELMGFDDYAATLARGSFDVALCETQLTADFSLDSILGAGGALNFCGEPDEELTALLAAFRAADSDGIAAAAENLYGYISRNAPIAPLAFERHLLIARRGAVSAADPAPHNLYRGIENW